MAASDCLFKVFWFYVNTCQVNVSQDVLHIHACCFCTCRACLSLHPLFSTYPLLGACLLTIYTYKHMLINQSLRYINSIHRGRIRKWLKTRHFLLLSFGPGNEPRQKYECTSDLASFPGSPLALTQNKKGESQFAHNIAAWGHHSNSYKSHDAIMQCQWLTQTTKILLLKQVSWDYVGEISAWLKQQRRQRSTQYIDKTLPIYDGYEAKKKDFSWLALHSGLQSKITTTFWSSNIATQQ